MPNTETTIAESERTERDSEPVDAERDAGPLLHCIHCIKCAADAPGLMAVGR